MNFREVKILGLWLDGANTELLCGGSERAHTHLILTVVLQYSIKSFPGKHTNDKQFADNVLHTMLCRFCIFWMAV